MKLITQELRRRLIQNGAVRRRLDEEGEADPDFYPVVKLFTPDAACTWLLTELDPEDPEIAFGLCDRGLGFPELGSVYLPELAALRGRLGLPVERDRNFAPRFTLSVYADAARKAQCIVEDPAALEAALAARHSRDAEAN